MSKKKAPENRRRKSSVFPCRRGQRANSSETVDGLSNPRNQSEQRPAAHCGDANPLHTLTDDFLNRLVDEWQRKLNFAHANVAHEQNDTEVVEPLLHCKQQKLPFFNPSIILILYCPTMCHSLLSFPYPFPFSHCYVIYQQSAEAGWSLKNRLNPKKTSVYFTSSRLRWKESHKSALTNSSPTSSSGVQWLPGGKKWFSWMFHSVCQTIDYFYLFSAGYRSLKSGRAEAVSQKSWRTCELTRYSALI